MNTQIKILVGMLFTLATTAVLIVLGVNEEARMERNAANFAGRQIEKGAEYYANYCVTCHGLRGEGVAGRGPTINRSDLLDTKKNEYLKEIGWGGTLKDYVKDVVASGRPQPSRYYAQANFLNVMPTWSQDYGGPLRPDQVDALVSFVLNWEPGQFEQTAPVIPPGVAVTTGGPTPTPRPTVAGCDSKALPGYGCAKPPFALPPSDQVLSAGKAVYDKNCASCHGEKGDGKGPAAGGLPKPPRSFADCAYLSNLGMDMHYARVMEGIVASGMPAWKSILKENDIWNVVLYERSFCKLFEATTQK